MAVWCDETLNMISGKLDMAATTFAEFEGSQIRSVHAGSLYTVAWLESGHLFWWLVTLSSLALNSVLLHSCIDVVDVPACAAGASCRRL